MEATFATVEDLVDRLRYVAESVSAGFDRWEDRYARGPSLYFLVASGTRFDPYADPLGSNEWPVGTARRLDSTLDPVMRAAEDVAFDCDGAVVVTADGTFQRQMVRVRAAGVDDAPDIDPPDWMSAKHLSALETSVRPEVLAAVTLSEDNGRVTVFRDGDYEDLEREALGGQWRSE